MQALALYGETKLDVGDAMLVATMRQADSSTLYSYNRDFDTVAGIERVEPPPS
ncbi:MAG: type II toxin-antitoxin system VapC family toxin [Chloroflexota bacterium]